MKMIFLVIHLFHSTWLVWIDMILIISCLWSLLFCQPINDARFSCLTVQQAWPCRRKWCLTTWREISPCPCGSSTITTPDRTNTSKSTFSAMRMITVKNYFASIYICSLCIPLILSIFIFHLYRNEPPSFLPVHPQLPTHFTSAPRVWRRRSQKFPPGWIPLEIASGDFWLFNWTKRGEKLDLVYISVHVPISRFSLSTTTVFRLQLWLFNNLWAPNNNNSPKLIRTFPQLGLRWPMASLRRVHGVPWSAALRRWPPYGCQQE